MGKFFGQLSCSGKIWSTDQVVVKVPGKTLTEYPAEERNRKEVQLEANLKRAMEDITENIADNLHIQPCTSDKRPQEIKRSWLTETLNYLF